MPPFRALSDEQVWQVVSYLRSLSGSIEPTRANGPVSSAASRAGEALFFGKANCATCHQVNGRGGVVGPDLSTAGRLAADALRRKILDPRTALAQPAAAGRGAVPPPPGRGGAGARPQVVVAKTRDGREVRGVQRNEDTFSVQMPNYASRTRP